MKLQTFLILFPLLVAANPLAAPEARPAPDALAEPVAEPVAEVVDRRAALMVRAAHTCALTGSNVRYRKCPAIGEYGKKGTKVSFKCYTTGGSVGGNIYWDKTSSGYYVSETLVDPNCSILLDPC